MDIHHYLGVNHNECCIIKSPVLLTKDNVNESIEFCKFSSTNWMGRDTIDRTCSIKNIDVDKIIEKIKLNKELVYSGKDYDMGHTYEFKFRFNELWRYD